MLDIMQLSEEDLIQWLIVQLEKHEVPFGRQRQRKKVEELLYEILFLEQGVTVEEIERYFVPFSQSGYLSVRQKFEIILYVLERDYGNCLLFRGGTEPVYAVTEEDIEELYYQWLSEDRLFLSDEEKKDFFVRTLYDKLGPDILEVLGRVAPDGILLGEFCPCYYPQERVEERIAICSGGAVIRLPFLAVKNKEELIKMMKCFLAGENKGELTVINPVLDYVKEDGTCITAVRPPAGKEWGIRVLYGAARKGGTEWKMS